MKGKDSTKRYRIWMGCMLAALITSVALFFTLLQVEKNVLSSFETQRVWVSCRQIPKGQLIDEGNVEKYLELREVNKAYIPENAFLELEAESILFLLATYDIDSDTILTKGMFENKEEILEEIPTPVIAGFKVEDMYQMVGGVLRRGDRINIYSVDDAGSTHKLWEELFVQQVFDSSGVIVENDDLDTAVMRINVFLDGSDVEKFYSQLASGSIRVVKLCE